MPVLYANGLQPLGIPCWVPLSELQFLACTWPCVTLQALIFQVWPLHSPTDAQVLFCLLFCPHIKLDSPFWSGRELIGVIVTHLHFAFEKSKSWHGLGSDRTRIQFQVYLPPNFMLHRVTLKSWEEWDYLKTASIRMGGSDLVLGYSNL